MTLSFRSRVLTAAVAAAMIAVLLFSTVSFFTTRNALLSSADVTLMGNGVDETDANAYFVLQSGQIVGQTPGGAATDHYVLHLASLDNGRQYFRTVRISNHWIRELLKPELFPYGDVSCSTMDCMASSRGVLVTWIPFDGQIGELGSLLRNLLFAGTLVLLLALTIGLWLTQQALRPLELVTNEIEKITNDQDVSRRVVDGGPDEIGRLRRVFNRLLASVDESQMLQRQLVLDASHELRTPLTSLRTNAQVLSRVDELSPDDLAQLSSDMTTQVNELATLIGDLAELARGERSEGVIQPMLLDEIVEDCVDTARTYARIKNITIDVTSAPSTVDGRPDRLTRAVSNLLTNAIKFAPEGGRINVTITPGQLVVADNGPGIRDEDHNRVFDRFWRAPSSRGLPGSGLGLSIVYQVVTEFDGTVTVDRDPELGGARFTITLPYR